MIWFGVFGWVVLAVINVAAIIAAFILALVDYAFSGIWHKIGTVCVIVGLGLMIPLYFLLTHAPFFVTVATR